MPRLPGPLSDTDAGASRPATATRVVLHDSPPGDAAPSWIELSEPVRELQAHDLSSVTPLLEEVDAAAAAGLYAAGFVTYEAAPAFDAALVTRPAGQLPLAWFGLFTSVRRHRELPPVEVEKADLAWMPTLDSAEFAAGVESIRSTIAAGETYQANFTFRLRSPFDGDPWSLFAHLVAAQPVRYAAYVELGNHTICSLSPELFFDLAGEVIRSRPMKGTARRGLTTSEDHQIALDLYNSQKNRAENLMIVDMLRNDLGRIAVPGSVTVDSLFDLETYESIHQLTSSVSARTTRSIPEIFRALFPCASITGAPKVRTMELLSKLEPSARGIYTGAIGFVAPGRRAQFNVAIRTIHIDRLAQTAEYGTGAGIVWDSSADDEYSECAAKALVLGLERTPFELFETLRWDPGEGFFLLERHLDRLRAAADYFGIPFSRPKITDALSRCLSGSGWDTQRVRLVLHEDGQVHIERRPLPASPANGWRVAVSGSPVDISDRFLYHKTTARYAYDEARASAPGYDDVLLWNARDQFTESTIANVVYGLDGRFFTPPVEDGLLPGTFREELLANRDLSIRSLEKVEIPNLEDLWLINSVRRWIRVECLDELGLDGSRTLWRNNSPASS